MRHKNEFSVRQFERIMMSVWIVLIYLTKSGNSEVGGLFPDPALIVFYVLIKGQSVP
jgi:hypothetical protein